MSELVMSNRHALGMALAQREPVQLDKVISFSSLWNQTSVAYILKNNRQLFERFSEIKCLLPPLSKRADNYLSSLVNQLNLSALYF